MSVAIVSGSKPPVILAPQLLITSGPQRGTAIKLDLKRLQDKPLVLGRLASEVDFILQSSLNQISRRHASISLRTDDRLLVVTDLGSANGTMVNSTLLAGPVPLLAGDVMSCGDVDLTFIAPPLADSLPIAFIPGQTGRQYLEDTYPEIGRLEIVSSLVPYLRPGAFCRLTPDHPCLIGRHATADLRLVEEGEAGREVSRRQAEIRFSEGEYLIRDLGATNPFWVNGEQVVSAKYLKEGDLIQVSSTVIRYRAPRLKILKVSRQTTNNNQNSTYLLNYAAKWPIHLGPPHLQIQRERPVTIGRSKDNWLRLNDPSISRQHAILDYSGNGFVLKDKGSANGSLVNGVLIKKATLIKKGDHLKFGEFEFIFDELNSIESAASRSLIEAAIPLVAPVTLELELYNPENLQTNNGAADLPSAQIPLPGRDVTRFIGNFDKDKSRTQFPSFNQIAPVKAQPELKVVPDAAVEGKTFEEVINTYGQLLDVSGNEPFLLDDPQSVWLVRFGKVEIFAVQVQQGQPINARHHVCSTLLNQAFFGLDSNQYGEGLGLLAVGMVGTQLLKVPLALIQKMAKTPALSPTITRLLDEWVISLTTNITKGTLSTRTETFLGGQRLVSVEPQLKAGPHKGNYWIKFVEGEALFLGEEELASTADEVLFPLYGDTWIQALSSCQIECVSTEEIIAKNGIWSGLDLFYELFFRLKFTSIRLITYDEINRLRKKAEFDLAAGHKALNYLYSILEKDREVEEEVLGQSKKELYLSACRAVGKVQGITVQPSPSEEEKIAKPDLLGDIARASRFHTREITLEPNWWQKENGPILGHLKDSGSPIALLPVTRKGYVMFNPEDGSRVKLSVKTAEELSSTAYIFYRPFPEKKLAARDLIKFGLFGSRGDLVTTIILGFAGGILGLVVPIITGYLFDSVIPSAQSFQLLQILVALVVVAISSLSFTITRGIATLRLETKLDISIQSAVWDRLLGLPATFFRKYSVGDLATRALGIEEIRRLISSSVITAVLGNIFGILSFGLLFIYDFGLALIALALTLIILGIILGLSLLQLRFQKKLANQQGKISGLVLQLITGISKIRVAGAEIRAFMVWSKEFSIQRKLSFKARTVTNYQTVFNSVLPILTVLVIFASIGFLRTKGLSIGAFLAFMAAFGQFLFSMIAMASSLTAILQTVPVYDRARPIFETLPEAQSSKADPGELSGEIEINHVTFRYNTEAPYILNDISITIKPGQFVAFVGPSGAGKSSLFRLLLGFESAEAGSIYYDNQDLAGLNTQLVRRQIGVVLQNGKLMPGDIFTNIIGSAPYTLNDAWEAARLAGIEKDIQEMPMGMYTLVSEGGSTLSGGQKQRLMIARAIISKPRIILLDEATSALDNQNQSLVGRSMETLKATRVVIAHRLSTIVNADCIYVLDGGKIVQTGTYTELIGQEGAFQKLAARQLA